MRTVYHSPMPTTFAAAMALAVGLAFGFLELSSTSILLGAAVLLLLIVFSAFTCNKVDISEDFIRFSYPFELVDSKTILFEAISAVEYRQIESRVPSARFVIKLKSQEQVKVSLETGSTSAKSVFEVFASKGIEVVEMSW